MVDYKKLQIWERSHAIVLEIYKLSKEFPKEELYGLTSQLRRSSVSISSNIAEGCGRNSDAELARFLVIAMGSAAEAEYQLLLAKDLGYMDDVIYKKLDDELNQIRKMLNAFIKKVNVRK
ncbi:MAG: four helix bundle protein [Saprospiraceae bacterium]|jgi:four helix bundle protein|nr:four helix bundle protein [Saprospiraceae bacterium]MBP6448592.1 four helix bundle protein [Saprospiraceae bacterium]